MRRLLALSLLLAGCSRAAPSPSPAPSSSPKPEAATYVGAERCAECHEGKHKRWQADWHARALAPATADNVEGSWNVHFRGEATEAWMKRDGAHYVVRTRDRDGRLGDHAVQWVIGGKRMQDPVTVMPDGSWQVLPVYWHATTHEWVDYNGEKQGRVGPDHPFFWSNFRRNVNHECLDCHTTGLESHYGSGAWSTRFADGSVACESCHGPGSRHVASEDARDIVHPRKAGPEAGFAICAQCHGPRNPLFPLLDAEHRFRPGQRYEDAYDTYFLTAGPGERSLDFFADGRPRSGSFEVQALLQSACYRKGGATCLSCHTAPHEEHGANELKDAGRPDASCRNCHAAIAADAAGHSRHRAARGQSCVACHMPPLVPAVLDLEADHSLDVPNPGNTVRHGVPNACNVCHADRTPQQMADALARLWPDAAARQSRRTRLADAFDARASENTVPAREAVAKDGAEAPLVRGAALLLLAEADRSRAAALAPGLLADESPALRLRAVNALAYAAGPAAAGAISALRDDPSPFVRQAVALALFNLDAPEAGEVLRAVTTDPRTAGLPQPHLALGVWQGRHLRDFAAAAREIERAVALKPYDAGAHVALSDAWMRLGRPADARRELEAALRFDPSSAAAQMRLERLALLR